MVTKWQRGAVFALIAIAAPLVGAGDKKNVKDDGDIVLNSSAWVGQLKLDKPRLGAIKKALESALTGPVDAEQQCGDESGLCTVRTAREWMYKGDRYREIVVNVHMLGHASKTVKQHSGVWPSVSIE